MMSLALVVVLSAGCGGSDSRSESARVETTSESISKEEVFAQAVEGTTYYFGLIGGVLPLKFHSRDSLGSVTGTVESVVGLPVEEEVVAGERTPSSIQIPHEAVVGVRILVSDVSGDLSADIRPGTEVVMRIPVLTMASQADVEKYSAEAVAYLISKAPIGSQLAAFVSLVRPNGELLVGPYSFVLQSTDTGAIVHVGSPLARNPWSLASANDLTRSDQALRDGVIETDPVAPSVETSGGSTEPTTPSSDR